MATKPDKNHQWATGAGANVEEPQDERSRGYPVGYPVPSEAHNWQFEMLGEYIDYLLKSAGQYAHVSQAIEAGVEADDTFVLGSVTGAFGSELNLFSSANTFVDLDHDGRYLITLENGDGSSIEQKVTIFDQEPDSLLVVATFTTGSTAADAVAISCNGQYIAVGRAGGATVIYDYEGNVYYSVTHNGTLRDLWLGPHRLILVGASTIGTGGTDSREVRAYNIDTKAFEWEASIGHGADMYSVASDGAIVYAAGAANGSDEHVLKLDAEDGTLLEKDSLGYPVTEKGRIAIGPRSVFFLTTNGATSNVLEERQKGPETDAVIDTLVLTGLVGNITADHRFVYVKSGGKVKAYAHDRGITAGPAHVGPTSNVVYLVASGHGLLAVDNTNEKAVRITLPRPMDVWECTGTRPHRYHWMRRRFLPSGV